MNNQKNIVLCGVGGQGTVLASKLLAAAAMSKDIPVMSAETIGMAQRGGSVFSHLIESVDHWIAFAILAFLGGRMILESFKEEECCKLFNPANPKVVLTMAIATSIDALAIGISFAFLGVQDYTEILPPISIIGFVSFVMSLIGLIFGIQCGCGIARKLKAELWGGIILVIIGLKILIEHLFLQ